MSPNVGLPVVLHGADAAPVRLVDPANATEGANKMIAQDDRDVQSASVAAFPALAPA